MSNSSGGGPAAQNCIRSLWAQLWAGAGSPRAAGSADAGTLLHRAALATAVIAPCFPGCTVTARTQHVKMQAVLTPCMAPSTTASQA